MAGLWQRTGNVTVTNGSKTITGFGTKWKTGTLPIQKGHTFYGPDNAAYEVDTVVSDESILLVDTYRGGTLANQAYRIDITRTSTISQFAADLASLVAKYRSWFDGMMTWLTGSGDVAILNPDTGANVTIPSWKKVASEGEGQAARAKVEADRAKTEADRALTEADRAAGIVAAAALPLPDVWVPFSDSLRMITGYGRDVLVGSDVVARMVNFSRSTTATYIGKDGQLKTAAANEPRFEKEGLLLEGQSTNLMVRSQQFNWRDGNGPSPGVQSPSTDPQSSALIPMVDVSPGKRRPLFDGMLTVGKTYTISFRAKSSGGTISQLASSLTGAVFPAVRADEWTTYSFTGVASTSSVDFQITGNSVSIAWIQVEELPFASSYIPTNGAAVTRSADVCWIPSELNVTPEFGNITIAAEVRRNQAIPTSLYPRLIHIADRQFIAADSRRVMVRGGGQEQAVVMVAATGLMDRIATTIRGETLACYLNGAKNEIPQTPTFPVSGGGKCFIGGANGIYGLFGHVRNVRIWQRTLSDEQIKAAA
jgi:hypothetical protein